MRTLAVMNQKGGTGKTTTSVTLATLIAQRGQRTLLVDFDPQGHAGLALAVPERRVNATIADVLNAPHDADTAHRARWTVRPNLTVIPSGPSLAALEAGAGALAQTSGRELRLRNWLETVREDFDVCLIDCSPAIGLLTFNALVASSAVLVPIETSYFALRGAERQVAMIDAVARRTGAEIETWVVPTMHTPGETPAERILSLLQHRYRNNVAPVPIRRDPSVGEAQTLGVPVHEHRPDCHASRDYQVLADWVLGRLPMLSDQPRSIEPVHGAVQGPMSRAQELAERARDMHANGSQRAETRFGVDPVRTGTITEIKAPEPEAAEASSNGSGFDDAGGAGAHRPGGTDERP